MPRSIRASPSRTPSRSGRACMGLPGAPRSPARTISSRGSGSIRRALRRAIRTNCPGGQRQRVNIARALALQPRLLILDEAVSALDKSIEAQVLNLLVDLKAEFGLTYMFISHDLNVVRFMSDRVMVMYLGKVAELGASDVILANPRHPYTMALLASMPSMDPDRRTTEAPLFGDPPNPIDPPSGCRFHTRCKFAAPVCSQAAPALAEVGPAHRVACLMATPGSGHPQALRGVPVAA